MHHHSCSCKCPCWHAHEWVGGVRSGNPHLKMHITSNLYFISQATAQALGSGFGKVKPELWAPISCHHGSGLAQLSRAGLGWHITGLMVVLLNSGSSAVLVRVTLVLLMPKSTMKGEKGKGIVGKPKQQPLNLVTKRGQIESRHLPLSFTSYLPGLYHLPNCKNVPKRRWVQSRGIINLRENNDKFQFEGRCRVN